MICGGSAVQSESCAEVAWKCLEEESDWPGVSVDEGNMPGGDWRRREVIGLKCRGTKDACRAGIGGGGKWTDVEGNRERWRALEGGVDGNKLST